MEPLRKALRLPRVNLFIADDTGLGKTIEAGLIARELLLRKKAKTIVVAAPPSVLEQWKGELEERFGLVFEILDRAYLTRMRRERGFGVNPWRTHSRFLVSHNLLIDPTYADPMREWLGPMLPGKPADPGRGAPRGALERRALRHRDEVHARGARSRRPLRAPAVPLGHAAQRPLEQLLDAPRAARPLPLHPRRQGARQEGARGRDGAPPQGGHPRSPGRVPEARRRARRDRRPARQTRPSSCCRACSTSTAPRARSGFAGTTRRAQAAAGLLVVGLQQRLLSSIEAFARSLKVHRANGREAVGEGRRAADADATKRGDMEAELFTVGARRRRRARRVDAPRSSRPRRRRRSRP